MITEKVEQFRHVLLNWGTQHFRYFPWRLTENPYNILVAEVMLHRTQASQVLPVYWQFIQHYPDIGTLAHSDKNEVISMVSSLGLRWRANMLYQMAQELEEKFAGRIPTDKAALLSLPGVSDYIASAVRCFAWNIPEPIVDTNTVRITGRLYGLETRDSSRRNTRFRQLITNLVDPEEPRAFNYALLDLGYQICTARQPPKCQECPVQMWCIFGQSRILGTSE